MKKLLIILFVIGIFQSCTVKIDPKDFYINEDFVLIDKYDKDVVVNGYTKNLRTWEIVKIETTIDSMFVGIIQNYSDDNKKSCGCGGKNLIITDELWNSKEVGDILHFDYIRKDRFHKEKKTTAQVYSENSKNETEVQLGGNLNEISDSVKIINLNKLEIERRILEIEREIMSLEREKQTLIESQK